LVSILDYVLAPVSLFGPPLSHDRARSYVTLFGFLSSSWIAHDSFPD